ncbi:phasin family protein [Sporolactobacillus terrae]|uniref:Polyhydroxyalkanoate synthesis regulator n=2 Tax=Sporolactobacillus terrae TaxID=269673 RepID=A0A410D8Q6_9BACL|nr:hypothetical protein [Sporolactobacillus terrae]QAA22456.1 hypothetical protein C0674_07365 [Sporolactobacillus terrae]QAA25430.1 hypothetical protein C0679_07345 [Sporolactobacillus terrae]BBN98775.1 hypothetical protein St703_14800 [Sporolactobacillus terrae]
MNEWLKTGFLIGIGAASAGKEKVEKILSDLSNNGSAAADETKVLLKTLGDKGKKSTENLNQQLHQGISDSLHELGFVTHEELAQLQQQIAFLETEIKQLKAVVSQNENEEK